MELYAGIDLHSNNSVVLVLDEQDRVVRGGSAKLHSAISGDSATPTRA